MHLALLQLPANPSDRDALPAATAAIRQAAAAGTQVVVLPELFRWSYFCQDMHPAAFAKAEPADGPTATHLAELARELGVVIVAPFFERAAAGLYFNSAACIDADGSVLGVYRKAHIPCDPHYEEKFYFAPGDSGFPVFSTRFGRIGILICWDQWFPEAARLVALAGAELIVYPTAIGSLQDEPADERERQRQAWQTVQRGHAIANGVFVAAVNRVGLESHIDFWGESFVCGPQGEVLVHAGDRPGSAHVKLDLARLQDVRDMWPFFRDRRIDAYGPLQRRWFGP
jgi:N-carbamoylputrescine amidase